MDDVAVQIPLTVYKRGVRTVIGMCHVEPDGAITAQVNRDHWDAVKPYFTPNVGELSIGPAPRQPTRAPDSPKV